jgi:hypothetical protein
VGASRIINAPSLTNLGLLDFGREVDELAQAGVPWFHVDIMDGHYVPNLCLPIRVIGDLKQRYPAIEVDVHLMVTDPLNYLPQLADNRADWVSFHMDATNFSRRVLATIRERGMNAGVSYMPLFSRTVAFSGMNNSKNSLRQRIKTGYLLDRPDQRGFPRHSIDNATRLVLAERPGARLPHTQQAVSAIFPHPREDDSNSVAANHISRRVEQYIHGRTMQAKRWSLAQSRRISGPRPAHSHMSMPRRQVDGSRSQYFPPLRFNDPRLARSVQARRKRSGESFRHVLHDKRRRAIGWKSPQKNPERFRPTR